MPPAVAVAKGGTVIERIAFPIETGSGPISDADLAKVAFDGFTAKLDDDAEPAVIGFTRFDLEPPMITTVKLDSGDVVQVRPTSQSGDEVAWECARSKASTTSQLAEISKQLVWSDEA